MFDACAEVLRPLGRPEYLGVEAGLAQLYYQAVFAIFVSGPLAFEQALAMIDRSGEPIARFLPYAQQSMGDMRALYGAVATMAADTGGWRDIGHLRMMTAGAGHAAETAAAVGVDTGLARAVQNHWLRALSESERTGVPISTFQLLRGSS
ncbi:hypothetical protein [Nocardia sp. NPDC051750]|uniref:imine reductase family protein n=1 Tax=Nocardia sp. NPDC051750 TaxID=3364325 RepID=UPI0037BBBB90